VGASLSSIFVVYSMENIFRCFFMASAVFLSASIYGRVTSKDLSSMRSTLIVAMWGVLFTSLFNMFMRSSGMQYIISILIIGIFSGFIAYDMQQLLGMYFRRESEEVVEKISIMGALHLFISIINIFVALLYLFDNRRK
jgi:FtsH-binding integral membrane protein